MPVLCSAHEAAFLYFALYCVLDMMKIVFVFSQHFRPVLVTGLRCVYFYHIRFFVSQGVIFIALCDGIL